MIWELKLKEGSSTKSILRVQLAGKCRRLPWAGWELLQRVPPRDPWKAAQGPASKVGAGSGTKRQSNQRAGQSKGNPDTRQHSRLEMVTLWSWVTCHGQQYRQPVAQSMKEGPALTGDSWQDLGRIAQTSEFGLRRVLVGSTAPSR